MAVLQLDLVVAVVEPQDPGPGGPGVVAGPGGRRFREDLKGGDGLGILGEMKVEIE